MTLSTQKSGVFEEAKIIMVGFAYYSNTWKRVKQRELGVSFKSVACIHMYDSIENAVASNFSAAEGSRINSMKIL